MKNKMYTILINDDNTLTKSVVERIMHRSHNVNSLRFLMNPTYTARNGQVMDMAGFTMILEYVLPISRTYKTVILSPEAELYKDRLQYVLPVTTDITSEVGEVELKFTMTKLDMLEDGSKIEYVRHTSETYVNILAVENWSDYIANSDLSNIAEMMLIIQAQQEQLKAYAEQINALKADAIRLDTETSELALYAGEQKLSAVDLDDLGDSLAESTDDGLVKVITI